MNSNLNHAPMKMIILSGLLLALMGFMQVSYADSQSIISDYSDDLQGYCHAVAELNYSPSSSMRLREARTTRYLVMCRTKGQQVISFADTEPLKIVSGPDGRYILVYDSWEKAEDAIAWLQTLDDIMYAERDSVVTASADDGQTISFRSEGAEQINLGGYLLLAQQYGTGSQTVAVIDSGVSNHSLLSERMKFKGYDYVDADTDPTNDLSGHGTHVAGIIADCTTGTPVWIYPIRVLNSVGTGQMSNVVSAVLEATEANVDVINLSLESFEMSEALDDAIESAENQGVTVVIAAGNHSCDTSGVCPAHLTGEGIIVVGSAEASETGYHRADYSNYGNSVDLYAFGTNINSCSRSGGYVVQSGTSMAAAHVSGICALMGLTHPGLSPQTVEQRLKSICCSESLFVPDISAFVPRWEGFSLTRITLDIGDVLRVPIQALPLTSYDAIHWTSENENVATVDQEGNLYAVSVGETELLTSCMGFTDHRIHVKVEAENCSTIVMAKSMKHIGEEAFMNSGGKHIVVPSGVEEIGDRAFAECRELYTVSLPNSINIIGDGILDGSRKAIILCESDSIAVAYADEHGLPYIALNK